jgi:hypothetical protein
LGAQMQASCSKNGMLKSLFQKKSCQAFCLNKKLLPHKTQFQTQARA